MKIELDWDQRRILTELANEAIGGIEEGSLHYDDNEDMIAELSDIILALNPGEVEE